MICNPSRRRDGLNLIFALLVGIFFLEGLSGCAGPAHIMNLPSTIPSGKVENHALIGTAPESSIRYTDDPVKYNDYFGSVGASFRHQFLKYGILGIQADYNMFTSGQISASLSFQPIRMLVGSVWAGIDPRAGSIGGLEAMTGTRNISVGGGYAMIRSVSFIDYSWGGTREPTTWSRHLVPYGRISGGWKACELDFRVGKTTNAWQPWMWQATIQWKFPEPE